MTNTGNPASSTASETSSRRFYHGTRADLQREDLIQPGYCSNYTERKSQGAYRSREPLRVVGEYVDWQGHSPDEIQAMKNAIAGLEPIDD